MNQQFQPVTPLVLAAEIEAPACRTVALALADLQDHCGASFAASMHQLAGVVGLSKVQTRKHVHALVSMGVLQVTANAHGGAPSLVPHYRFDALRLRALAQQTGKTPDLFNFAPAPRMHFFAADGEESEYARQRMAAELHGRAGDRFIRFFQESAQGDIGYGCASLRVLMLPPCAKGAWSGWLKPQPDAPDWAHRVYTFPETVEKLQQWAQEMALGRPEGGAATRQQAIEQKGSLNGH